MRKSMMIPAVVAASFSVPAFAEHEYYDEARVISVTPQTERVNYPRQECHTGYVRESVSNRSPVGAIIGGIAGGLLGSQVGKGNGRVAGAAVGAGVGAVVGDRIGNNQSAGYTNRPVEHCSTVDNWETVTSGYQVTYLYNGREYTTMTETDPGRTIRVKVAVAPEGRGVNYYEPVAAQAVYREPVVVRFSSAPRGYYHGKGHGKHHGHRGHYW
jgi:uncharacterized protein YcfJ